MKRRYLKRSQWIWIGICSLLLLLGGCAGPGSEPPPAAKTVVTLSGWQSDPTERQRLQQILADFEAQHPTIQVKYEVITDQYMDVIRTRLIGRRAPDVFYLESFEAPLLMRRRVLEPLNAYITPEFDLADFNPRLLQVFQEGEQIYGLPKDFSTLALIYNQAALQAAGLTEPPTTWNQFRQAARQLTRDRRWPVGDHRNGDRRIGQYGAGLLPELARQAYLMTAFGGQFVDAAGDAAFASPAGLQGLQLLVDQYRRDRTAVLPSDVGVSSGSELLGQGKVAMVVEGPWALSYLQTTFPELALGTAEVPQVNGKPGTMVYTVAYVMNRRARHKQAAWELIAYLTGKAGMRAWTSQGLALPSRRSVAAALQLEADPLRSPFLAGVDYATPWQGGEYLALIRDSFNNQFLSALLGQQSLAAALQQAQTTANREIQLSR